jgi:hypothetical protein
LLLPVPVLTGFFFFFKLGSNLYYYHSITVTSSTRCG